MKTTRPATLMRKFILLSCFFLVAAGCSPGQSSGPGEVRWDRETCTRCNMAVGDRFFAAQVRAAAGSEQSRLYKFDDIGCAVIWLDTQPWKDDEHTEIWVADHHSGEWLDARTAFYITGKISPMNYGLGAQAEAAEGALDFSQAIAHIRTAEKEHHRHGGHTRSYP
jgi:nitrous oxide reductase accessory protein NosL